MMLEVEGIEVFHGRVPVLRGLSLGLDPGEVLAVMGRNGAGKTTLLRAIMGLLPLRGGAIRLDGARLDRLPAHRVPRAGLGYVPQGRRLFADLTVAENLAIGLMARRRGPETRARVLDLLPRLRERLDQRAGTLSGGEQQMLALARALCLGPRLLLLDEPTEGLQPSTVALIAATLRSLRAKGVAVLLVEQRMETARTLADRIAFIEGGACPETLPATSLPPDAPQFRRYVGL
jgi:branched-chain amino acid transport system ATP-binding protein